MHFFLRAQQCFKIYEYCIYDFLEDSFCWSLKAIVNENKKSSDIKSSIHFIYKSPL